MRTVPNICRMTCSMTATRLHTYRPCLVTFPDASHLCFVCCLKNICFIGQDFSLFMVVSLCSSNYCCITKQQPVNYAHRSRGFRMWKEHSWVAFLLGVSGGCGQISAGAAVSQALDAQGGSFTWLAIRPSRSLELTPRAYLWPSSVARVSQLSDENILWELGVSYVAFSHLVSEVTYWHVCCEWLVVSQKPIYIQREATWFCLSLGGVFKNSEDVLRSATVQLLAKNYFHFSHMHNAFTLPKALPQIIPCFSL